MTYTHSFIELLESSLLHHWNDDALTDFKGVTFQYKDVARKIEKLHILFENCGIQQGDKVALCGRNSAHWAVTYLATLTYGAVAVPILHEFNTEQIHNIANHCEAKLLFVGDVAATMIDAHSMPALEGIVYLPDFSLRECRTDKLRYAREHLNELFGKKYPKEFSASNVHYRRDEPEQLALINYTSGTTGHSKGVMIPYRALHSNTAYCMRVLGQNVAEGSPLLSILPMSHMYGMTVEFLFSVCHGCHLYFLTRLPSPAVIADAFSSIHPAVVISVPLVVEKIIRKRVFPRIQNNVVRLLLTMPVVNKKVKQRICELVSEAFGGKMYQVVVGGAALNHEIERFLHLIGFPLTVGYGTTECAPLITFSNHGDYLPNSCGLVVDNMEIRIASEDPENKPGEILTRGTNVMLGYYKNPEATREAIDNDGWYHTGDLGTLSADGHLYIKGRIKNMLLGSNGQNVYPEEIEDKLNSMTLVMESIIIQRGNHLIALVHPDTEHAQALELGNKDLRDIMEQNRKVLNASLPAYCRLHGIELHYEEFEKTPKKSIKRHLYRGH